MMKVFLSVLGSDSEKTIDIPSGKTVLGRGPFLGCSDKKVSRNHAVLEVQSNGDIFLTPTHVNPCFYRTTSETTLRIIKKDIPQKLQPGDVFSLLPNSFQYEVHQKTPDGKVLPLPSESLNKGKSNAPNSSDEDPLNTKSESNHSKKLTENGDSTDKTNMQIKSATPKSEGGKKEETIKNSETESKKSESTKSTLPKSSTSERSSLQKSSETPSDANNQLSNSCGAKSPKASQLSCPRRRTLPDWLVRSAASALKGTKSSNNGHHITNNVTADKKAASNAKISKLSSSTTVSNNNRVNSTGRSYTGRQNRQTIQKISLDDFVVSDDEEAQWKSPDESDDSSQRSKSRKGGRWHGRGGKRDSDSGSDWEMENRKSKKNWRSNEASSGSDWETTRTTSSQRKRRGRPQRKSYNSDSGSDWEMGASKRRSNRKKAAPVTRRPRRNAKRKASEDDDVDEDEDVRNESDDDGKKSRKRKARKEAEDVEDEKSTKSSPARSEGGRKREPCLYAKKCYRKNASHFDVYSHPGDSDYASPKEDDDEDDDGSDKKEGSEKKETKKESPQKECPYGIDCFRKNPQHKKDFKHTKKVRPTREASKKSSKYNEEEEEEEISMEESDEYDPAKEIAA